MAKKPNKKKSKPVHKTKVVKANKAKQHGKHVKVDTPVKTVEHSPSKKAHKSINVFSKQLSKLNNPHDVAIVKKLIEHWEEVNTPTKSEFISVPSKNYEQILEKMKQTITKTSSKNKK